MATDSTLPNLTAVTTPLAGTELIPIYQTAGPLKKVTRDNLLTGTLYLGSNTDGTAGTESLRVAPLASTVNRLTIQGAVTGNGATLLSDGSDAAVAINYVTKGAGSHLLRTGGVGGLLTQFEVFHTATAVNWWQFTGSAAGNGLSAYTAGASTNVSAFLATKGNGQWCFATGGSTGEVQVRVSQTVSAVNYAELAGGAAGNAVNFKANGSDAGVDMMFTPKGAGRMRSTGGFTSANATQGIGYETGAGGTVAQATSKATGVTLSKATGQITLNAANLAADTTVSFVLTNTAIAAGDRLILSHDSVGTFGAYVLNGRCAAGSATIDVHNCTPGALAEAIVVGFTLIKSVTA